MSATDKLHGKTIVDWMEKMKTTDIYGTNRNFLRKVWRNFTIESESADGVDSATWYSAKLVYMWNDWYSVSINERRDENSARGKLFITLYKSHPEWGVSILAEDKFNYESMRERTEILARELVECIGIIEID